MIKPPFTVLILKDSRHPVTIRVTTRLVVIFVGSIICLGAILGFAVSYMTFGVMETAAVTIPENPERSFVPAEPVTTSDTGKPEIQSISIRRTGDENSELSVHFSALPDSSELYIWFIVNPGDTSPGETVIHPRNPIFRGLPVDYRNGIIVFPDTEQKSVTIPLIEELQKIRMEHLRILVYSAAGDIVADRFFRESVNDKT